MDRLFFQRDLAKILERYSKFPVIALLGPRQSGKTTFARHYFPKHHFVSLETPAMREFAQTDPERFLRDYANEYGLIIDEFQYVPELLSYIQVWVDQQDKHNYFILTGSQNFLANEAITQSLAGRVGILTLLPLSLHEMAHNSLLENINLTILNGSYPRLHKEGISPIDVYPSYIQTYIERDVRHLTNARDMFTFYRFLKLCAERVGELLNIADIATQVGVDQRLIKQWLSVLEASYIIFLLQPHHNNFNKRLIKTPKLYFYDTGIACSLLGIQSVQTLALSPFRGHLFECLMISDIYKQYFNLGYRPSAYFWRDQNGRIEVDCIIDRAGKLIPIELKSGETIASSFFDSLIAWDEISGTSPEENYIIYGGTLHQNRSKGTVLPWKQADQLIESLYSKKDV